MSDHELEAIRTLLAPRMAGEPPTWSAVAARLGQVSPEIAPRTGRAGWRVWVTVPVAAALLVVAVASGAVVVRMYQDRGTGRSGGTAQAGGGSTPSPTAQIRGPVRQAGPFPDVGSLDPRSALLGLAAGAATATPASVSPGQLIYVHSVGWGRDPSTMPKGESLDVTGVRTRFTEQGPSLSQPSPGWLSEVPTDPAALRNLLTPTTRSSKWSVDRDIWGGVEDLLNKTDLLLPTAVRAAIYRMMADLPNLTAAEVDADGRRLVAIRYTETATWPDDGRVRPPGSPATDELLFDPATGHCVGVGSRTLTCQAGRRSRSATRHCGPNAW